MFCTNCGVELREADRFCSQCGKLTGVGGEDDRRRRLTTDGDGWRQRPGEDDSRGRLTRDGLNSSV